MTNVPMPRVERARGRYDVLERCRLAGRGVLVAAGRDRDHRQHRQDRPPGSFAPWASRRFRHHAPSFTDANNVTPFTHSCRAFIMMSHALSVFSDLRHAAVAH
jgi:hypothetical protein